MEAARKKSRVRAPHVLDSPIRWRARRITSICTAFIFLLTPALSFGQSAGLGQLKIHAAKDSGAPNIKEKIPRMDRAAIFQSVDGAFEASLPPESESFGFAGGGLVARLYEEAAPSVLFLRTENAFATGFVAGEPGLIVTNHHVIADATVDDDGRFVLSAVVGRLNRDTGFMGVSEVEAKAFVVKADEALDLALVRVLPGTPGAEGVMKLKPLQLRPSDERLGQLEDVFLIGNAGAGFLWAIKHGDVQQVGRFGETADVVNLLRAAVNENSQLSATERAELVEDVAGVMKETLVIEASAEAAGGDSGGPLLDSEGRVVGVCSLSVNFDDTPRYFYVHANELRDFLQNPPTRPLSPYGFPQSVDVRQLCELASGFRWELFAIADDGQEPSGAIFTCYDEDDDLCLIAASNTLSGAIKGLLNGTDKTTGSVSEIPDGLVKNFAPSFVWFSQYWNDVFRAFYDTDGEGGLDEMRIDADYDGMPDFIARVRNGQEAITGAGEDAPLLNVESLPPDSIDELYEAVFDKIEEQMAYLQNF